MVVTVRGKNINKFDKLVVWHNFNEHLKCENPSAALHCLQQDHYTVYRP